METSPKTMTEQVEKLVDKKPSEKFDVRMSVYEWHELLRDLEAHMRIINRDQAVTCRLYEKIASQLAGRNVVIVEDKPKPVVADAVSSKEEREQSEKKRKKWLW